MQTHRLQASAMSLMQRMCECLQNATAKTKLLWKSETGLQPVGGLLRCTAFQSEMDCMWLLPMPIITSLNSGVGRVCKSLQNKMLPLPFQCSMQLASRLLGQSLRRHFANNIM